ncbi:MAG: helix-turn-helix domain-containing protein [Peptococcaceae bacterium]
MNFAQKIQHLRKEQNLSQKQLANKLGISKQSVSKWESEQSVPGLNKVVLLSKIFDVTTDYLLKDHNESLQYTGPGREPARRREQHMDLTEMPGVTYCEFKKGSNMIEQGEKVEYIYYLVSGTCHRLTITNKGNEIIYGTKESKDFIKALVGVLVLYSPDGRSISNFIAKSKCYCYRIPKNTFFHYVRNKPDILTKLLCFALWEYRELYNTFQYRQEGKVPNRLCELLLKNAQNKHGKLVVAKAFSNSEIGRYLGIHKVTVAKILKALKEKGIIEKHKEGILVLDQAQLIAYAQSEKILHYYV